ncbi:hypothetical protein I3760_15G078200 [Carya illinoinensis]|nr:hypothetical protein I3760_15G078200 [Carya illinoinensis]
MFVWLLIVGFLSIWIFVSGFFGFSILVPALPAIKNLKARNWGPSQLEARSQKTSNQIQPPIEIRPRILSIDEEGNSMSLTPEKGIQFVRKSSFSRSAKIS